jgi:hypothetical protein
MKTIAFIFVPVYVERQNGRATVQPPVHDALQKACTVVQAPPRPAHQSEQPFWTWFIDNPRPPSTHQQ